MTKKEIIIIIIIKKSLFCTREGAGIKVNEEMENLIEQHARKLKLSPVVTMSEKFDKMVQIFFNILRSLN